MRRKKAPRSPQFSRAQEGKAAAAAATAASTSAASAQAISAKGWPVDRVHDAQSLGARSRAGCPFTKRLAGRWISASAVMPTPEWRRRRFR